MATARPPAIAESALPDSVRAHPCVLVGYSEAQLLSLSDRSLIFAKVASAPEAAPVHLLLSVQGASVLARQLEEKVALYLDPETE